MKLIGAAIVVAVIVGLAFWRGPRYIESYSMRGTPPPYEGPKYRTWKNGVEIK